MSETNPSFPLEELRLFLRALITWAMYDPPPQPTVHAKLTTGTPRPMVPPDGE